MFYRIKKLSFFLVLCLISSNLYAQAPKAPISVIVAPVKKELFADEVEALGTLRANETVELTANVTELITSVNFDDGERVEKGRLLVTMDDAEEMAEFTEEQARLQEATRQVERLSPLAAKGAASESALDERQREVDAAKARLNAIRSRLNQRRITAPFDGVLGLRNISVGALVQPGTLVTTIDDDSVMKLDFSVPTIFLPAVQPGMHIKARNKAYPEQIFNGTISSIDSRIDPITRSITIRAIIDNPERLLKPGMLMRVILHKNPRHTLIIPEEAIIPNGKKNHVLIALTKEGNTVAGQRNVTIGSRKQGYAEITEGLTEGEQVITHGGIKVRPGMAINIQATEEGEQPLKELLKQNNAD